MIFTHGCCTYVRILPHPLVRQMYFRFYLVKRLDGYTLVYFSLLYPYSKESL